MRPASVERVTEEKLGDVRKRRMQERDATYRAIGRYVVEFSLVVAYMQIDMIERICFETDTAPLAYLTLGEAPARQISDAFFAVCAAAGGCDKVELRILRKIQGRLNDEINRRNDFAHGDWFDALRPLDEANPATFVLTRMKPSRKTNPGSAKGYSSRDLEAAVAEVRLLASWVLDVGDALLRPHPTDRSLRDYFSLDENGAVTRSGVPGARSYGFY